MMPRIQQIGIAAFILFSLGFALGYQEQCPDGSQAETYMAHGLLLKITGKTLCVTSADTAPGSH